MDAAQPENRNLESGGGGGGGPREGGGLEAWLPVEGGDDDGRLGCVTNFLSFFLSPFSLSLSSGSPTGRFAAMQPIIFSR